MFRLESSWKRYGLAALVIPLIALLVARAGPSEINSDLTYFAFTITILATAIVGGVGPGLLATALAGFTSAFLFLPPIYSIHVASQQEAARMILFIAEGVLVSLLGDQVHDSAALDNAGSVFRPYLNATMFVAGVTILKLFTWQKVELHMPFALYYLAVAASAWAGGFAPGITATLLASLCARFFFLEPRYSLSVHSRVEAGRVLLFIAEGIVISVLNGMTIKARNLGIRLLEEMRHLRNRLWKETVDTRALRAISRDIIWEWDFPSASGLPAKGTRLILTSQTSFNAWLNSVHPKDRLKILGSLRAAMEQGRSEWSAEYRRLLPRRGYVRVSDRGLIIRDNSWNPVRVIGRSAEVRIEDPQGEGTYHAFFVSNPYATLLADQGLQIVDANDAACDVLGYTRDALKRMGIADLMPCSSRGLLLGLNQEDVSSITFEEDCLRANGEVFRAKMNVALVSGIEQSSVDRIITIEEIAEAES